MKYFYSILITIFLSGLINTNFAAGFEFNLDSLLKVSKKASNKDRPKLYLDIAKGYLERKNYDESINYLKQAIKISGGSEENEVMMKVYYSLGDNYIWQEKFDEAFKSLSRSMEIAKIIEQKPFQLDICLLYAYGYRDMMNYDKCLEYLNKAIDIAGTEVYPVLFDIYYVRAEIYIRKSMVDNAIEDFTKALTLSKQNKWNVNVTKLLNGMGIAYKMKGDYKKAIEYYQENLKNQEASSDSFGIGQTLNNIGNVYFSFNVMKEAIEYYNKSKEIYEKLKNESRVANLYYNIGTAYKQQKDNLKALECFQKGKVIFERQKSEAGLALVNSEMGNIYSEQGRFQMALSLQNQSLAFYKKVGEEFNITATLRYIAETYKRAGDFNAALNYSKEALEYGKKGKLKKEVLDIYRDIAEIQSKMGNYVNAFNNLQIYSDLKDSTLSEQYLNTIKELAVKYQTAQKENEIKLQKTEISKKESEAKRQKMFVYGLSLIILIVLGFLFVIYKQFQEKKKANILLAEQNDEIKKQRDQIFQQKKEITDSIHYASRIQRAVLPTSKPIEDAGLQYFILYKPRDIVSGDFYWINQKDEKVIVAAADCTGHGVPGAFMSMLGMALLNEIVSKGDIESAGQMLFDLRKLVVKSLHQSGKQEETKDGMDIALCIIDKEKNSIQFAGAFNPMYLIRNGEILEAPADRMPVGFHDKIDINFTNTEYQLQKGDSMYIFSDGYVDQFGGENGKKFMAKKFKQLLVNMQEMPMESQKEHLDKTITDWRGELDQVDDIMVIGMRV